MPILLETPKTDQVTGTVCPLAMVDDLRIKVIGGKHFRFTVWF